MASKRLFLSHIHEEGQLARLIKESLESEFSGFVDVFVSSDGTTILAGSNFLKRIEDGLLDCVGAIYLLSPASVRRSWINFELGAVWIRNVASVRSGNSEIPTVPMCHSGMTPSALPLPLGNLNGVVANQASQLEFTFRSLQTAVGGKGTLKTDFDALAARVIDFELWYTVGANLKKLLNLLGADNRMIVEHCEQQPPGSMTQVKCGFVSTNVIQELRALEATELRGLIVVALGDTQIQTNPSTGPVTGSQVELQLSVKSIVQFKDQLLS